MPWSEVPARESLKHGLARLVRSGRIGGTYLFYGPPGCDQESLALGFGSSILCERGDGDFCGVCRSCRHVRDQVHPDFFILDPDKASYSIEYLRSMQTVALSTPMEADWKIFVLRQADRMRGDGANSLLKTLEEPYDHCVFILVTEKVSGILPTIVSRCQRIRVAPLAPEELAKRLIQEKKMSEQEAQAVARLSCGRPGLAREMSDQVWLRKRDELLDLLETLRSGRRLEILRRCETWSQDRRKARDKARELVQALLGLLRDGLVLLDTGRIDQILNVDRADRIQALWRSATKQEVISAFEAAVDSLEALDSNLNVRNVLDSVFLACAGKQPHS